MTDPYEILIGSPQKGTKDRRGRKKLAIINQYHAKSR